ncbi:hypothetical protein BDR26DRAFT_837849 [Obelidium mucronatum]|nr:hypothetical protein BDR26DRAFT_837849 [Obelidium mucronatum]
MNSLEIDVCDFKSVGVTTLDVLPPLAVNSIRVKIEKFAISANNITYVALGKSMHYNEFFPTRTPNQTCTLPVWGVATVTASTHHLVQPGVRIYGYFPAASLYDFEPSIVTKTTIKVSRSHLPPDRAAYNAYEICTTDPLYTPRTENAMLLFRPLWFTSYLLTDYFQYHNYFDSTVIVVSSASSKTSFCFAQLISKAATASPPHNSRSIKVIGLTSKRNVSWTQSLGVYSTVIAYQDISAKGLLNKHENTQIVFVDVAGDPRVKKAVIEAVGGPLNVRKVIGVGISHFSPLDSSLPAIPPAASAAAAGGAPTLAASGSNKKLRDDDQKIDSEFFFAPEWVKKRLAQVGPQETFKGVQEGWTSLMENADKFISIKEFHGLNEAKRIYLEMLGGKASPDVGYIVSLEGGKAKI